MKTLPDLFAKANRFDWHVLHAQNRLISNVLPRQNVASILVLAALGVASSVHAKPIAFARGTTVMAEYGGGNMLEAQAFYAPSYRYSVGVSALRLENALGSHEQVVARLNYLLRRWNLPKAQGNLFVYGGLGTAHTRINLAAVNQAKTATALSLGWQADYETRWLYSSLRMDWSHSAAQSYRVDTAQFGLAPYAHGYRDWATFFLLQARQYQGDLATRPIQRGVELAALVRVFRGNFWLEAGLTDQGKPQAMLMMNF
jgi:hypothetical protein